MWLLLYPGRELPKLTGHIEFVDVSFSYPSRTSVSYPLHLLFAKYEIFKCI